MSWPAAVPAGRCPGVCCRADACAGEGAGDGAGVLLAQPARATAAARGTKRFLIMGV